MKAFQEFHLCEQMPPVADKRSPSRYCGRKIGQSLGTKVMTSVSQARPWDLEWGRVCFIHRMGDERLVKHFATDDQGLRNRRRSGSCSRWRCRDPNIRALVTAKQLTVLQAAKTLAGNKN